MVNTQPEVNLRQTKTWNWNWYSEEERTLRQSEVEIPALLSLRSIVGYKHKYSGQDMVEVHEVFLSFSV